MAFYSSPVLTVLPLSVVFASGYRFSVLFSYSNSDPTYTLAPTVGWTCIEMSAGITAAFGSTIPHRRIPTRSAIKGV